MKQLIYKLTLSLLTVFLFTGAAVAQYTVSGTVTDDNGNSLIGVSVTVKGTTTGSISDVDGKFTIRVQSNATLVFSYIGYEEREEAVTGANANLVVVMEESAGKLDEIIITGLASNVKRSNLATAVASISSQELVGTTLQSTMDQALYGKFTGVNIISNSGAPGGGTTIKLRGITTLNGNSQPLYIVDGVYYDNSTFQSNTNFISKAAGQGSNFPQDNPSNRAADLDPEDIERIEILKGASAAAIYGSRAAAGVVIITTKRGSDSGKPMVQFSQSIGQQSLLNPLGTRDWDAAKVEQFFGADDVPLFNDAVANGKLYNYEDELYNNKGMLATTRLSFSGGSDKLGYFAGITRKSEEGIIKNTGYEKTSARLNLDPKLGSFLDANISMNYVTSSSDRGFFNNDNTSTTMGVSFVSTPAWAELHPDANGNYPDNPYAPSNFLQTRDLMTNNEKVDRLLAGITMTAHLLKSDNQTLNLLVRGGVDQYSLTTRSIFPRELQFQQGNNGTGGASILGTASSKGVNTAAVLVHTLVTPGNTTFRTQFGLTEERLDQNALNTVATFLIGTQTNLDQASSLQTNQTRLSQIDRGGFVQEEVNIKDQLILTLGGRADKSSRNSDPNQLYFYPKASLAVNVHEFDFMGDALSTLRLRAAYGQSGNFGRFGAIYTTFDPVVIGSNTGSLISQNRGNSSLQPERQTELEAGIDIGIIRNRVYLDLTWYDKQLDDLLLQVEVPTSSGFNDFWQNAAAIRNNGIEIGLDMNIINKKNFEWNSRIAFWFNKAEVTRLDVPAFNIGAFGATLGTYRIDTLKSPTQLVGIGPDGQDYDKSDQFWVYGDAEPDFQMSFKNGLSVGNFDLDFLLHWKKGGEGVNLSTLLSDLFGTSPDFDNTSIDPTGELTNGNYRLSQLGVSAQAWIETTSYLRLREIGLSYNIPRSTFGDICSAKIGISGRNLINVFTYNSYDPEVSNFGTSAISSNVEVTPYPTAKSVHAKLTVTF